VPKIEREQLLKKSLNTFMLLFLVLGTLLGGMIAVFYQLQTQNYDKRICAGEQHSIELQLAVIRNHFDGIVSDLKFLVGQEDLKAYLQVSTQELLQSVRNEYRTYSASKKIYDQIRFLDEAGREVVRVNYYPDSPEIVAEQKLQDKSKRYYFTETLRLAKGEMFISPLDLNIERGKVELPYKPMLRFGAPVVDQVGEKRGIVLLNYLGQYLLDLIDDVGSVAHGQTMLVNADGYWLKHPDSRKEWGFMLADRSEQNFAMQFPELWQKILADDAGQLRTKYGIYTFATVRPLSGQRGYIAGDDYFWKIISFISADSLASYSSNLLINLFALGAGLFLLAATVAWLLAMGITRRKLYQAQLFSMAHFDNLTGLPNRSLFFDRLNQTLQLAKRHSRQCALLYIDLDGFKYVNDSLGHSAGDELLIAVGKRLGQCCRGSDTVARLGGDEFAVLLSEVTSQEGVRIRAEDLLAKFVEPFTLKKGEVLVGLSIGIGMFPSHATNQDSLLKLADQAMYRSKSLGKNRYTFADEEAFEDQGDNTT
jgi:diguanylate cyclase (GGDEF)-like protein